MDRKEFRRRFLLRLVGHPATLLPIGGGVTALLAAWAADLSGATVFGGLVAIVVGIGITCTRFATQGAQVAREVEMQAAQRQASATEAALEHLRARLASDRDTRDERLFDELRELVRAFRQDKMWTARTTQVSASEITTGVEQLFTACTKKLEDAFTLLTTVRGLGVEAARASLLAQREQMLTEVEASVRELAGLLTSVYTLGEGKDVTADTARVRGDLHRTLEVARQVDQRLRGSGKPYDEKEFES